MGTTRMGTDRTEALARVAMVTVPWLLVEEDENTDTGCSRVAGFPFLPESWSRLRVRDELKGLMSRQGGQPSAGDWKPLS